MDLNDELLLDRIMKLLSGLRARGFKAFESEEAVKQGVILPILHNLGWEIFNTEEVMPEYSTSKGRVDYALLVKKAPALFLEAKKWDKDLANHQEQLLKYAFDEGVKLAVLTNGMTWEFFLPLIGGKWAERKAYSIDVERQELSEATSLIINLLERQQVISGEAERHAKELHQSHQREARISEALPQAWKALIENPSNPLIDLLASETEAVCGYRPDNRSVQDYFAKLASPSVPDKVVKPATRYQPEEHENGDAISGTRARSVTFLGKREKVTSWVAAISFICIILKEKHPDIFESRVLSITSARSPLFSRTSSDLRTAHRIQGTGLFVENQQTADKKQELCFKLLRAFGYSESELIIEYY